jgi:hypothetical protein
VSESYDLSAGLEDLARLISFLVRAWHDFGYRTPAGPDRKPVPPLGRRSGSARDAAHGAVEVIDEMIRDLGALRGQLVTEMRADASARAAFACAMLAGNAEHKDAPECPSCGSAGLPANWPAGPLPPGTGHYLCRGCGDGFHSPVPGGGR